MLGLEHKGAVGGHQAAELAGEITDLASGEVTGFVHLGIAGVSVALVGGAAYLGALIRVVLGGARASEVRVVVPAGVRAGGGRGGGGVGPKGVNATIDRREIRIKRE